MKLLLPLIAIGSVGASVSEDLQEFNALIKDLESDHGFPFCINGGVRRELEFENGSCVILTSIYSCNPKFVLAFDADESRRECSEVYATTESLDEDAAAAAAKEEKENEEFYDENFGCKGGDTCKCYVERLTQTKRLVELHLELTTVTPDCDADTLKIDELIHDTYKDTDVTRHEFDNGIRNSKIENIDYTTNSINNEKYKQACLDEGGDYQELHFTATCQQSFHSPYKSGWSEGYKLGETVELVVSGYPRCYSKKCSSVDDHPLFEKYTLRLTELRADKEDGVTTLDGSLGVEYNPWICYGQLTLGKNKESCVYDTTSLWLETNVGVTANALKPDVTSEKFLFIFDKEDKIVNFSNDAQNEEYKTECEGAGGAYKEVPTAAFVCSSGLKGDVNFEVQNFKVCLGKTCADDGIAVETIIANQFKEQMVLLSRLKNYCYYQQEPSSLM